MQKIQDGVYASGDKLPSEAELARAMDVGRSTVREAVKILQEEHILISRNGIGTYVNQKSEMIYNSLNRLKSLGDMIRDAGFQASETDIRIYTTPAEAEWMEKLQTGQDVVVMERTRTADGQKVAFYYNILPQSLAGDAIRADFTGSLFHLLEEEMGITIAYAISQIQAVDLQNERDRKAVALLGDDTVLLKQLHFDTDKKPVLYSLDYLKSSAINLIVKRERY